ADREFLRAGEEMGNGSHQGVQRGPEAHDQQDHYGRPREALDQNDKGIRHFRPAPPVHYTSVPAPKRPAPNRGLSWGLWPPWPMLSPKTSPVRSSSTPPASTATPAA